MPLATLSHKEHNFIFRVSAALRKNFFTLAHLGCSLEGYVPALSESLAARSIPVSSPEDPLPQRGYSEIDVCAIRQYLSELH